MEVFGQFFVWRRGMGCAVDHEGYEESDPADRDQIDLNIFQLEFPVFVFLLGWFHLIPPVNCFGLCAQKGGHRESEEQNPQ